MVRSLQLEAFHFLYDVPLICLICDDISRGLGLLRVPVSQSHSSWIVLEKDSSVDPISLELLMVDEDREKEVEGDEEIRVRGNTLNTWMR